MNEPNFLRTISDVNKIITPIDNQLRFPEFLAPRVRKYDESIELFCQLVRESDSSADILAKIRTTNRSVGERGALLKIFRRCVSPVLDTEMTKKITKISTASLVENYGGTFKPITKLKAQFTNLSATNKYALAALLGEYDTRGHQGYQLTEGFFDWFESTFSEKFTIEGPRGAGPDIELSKIYPEFEGSFPCDFVIRRSADHEVLAIGFARYDSTRGGAQSDDRTGGNSNKVDKAIEFDKLTPTRLKMIFLADGPGLTHRDTWEETCTLDGRWDGRVRVTTLKLADKRITSDWLES